MRTIKQVISVLCALCMVLTCIPNYVYAASGSDATEFWVSPAGDDSVEGTESNPFKTIEHARDEVRKINGDMDGDINVYLKEGEYNIDTTITFDLRDSATNGYNISYLAAPGETPVISGGKQITNWQMHDIGNNIYKAENVNFNFRQLYVNGKKAIRSRSTASGNGNFNRTLPSPNTVQLKDIPADQRQLYFKSSEVSNWNNFDKVEFHALTAWVDNIRKCFKTSRSVESMN